jgi:hypothetical protein
VAAQLAPVRGIERSQLRPDWHGYAASFVVQRSIAARKDNEFPALPGFKGPPRAGFSRFWG